MIFVKVNRSKRQLPHLHPHLPPHLLPHHAPQPGPYFFQSPSSYLPSPASIDSISAQSSSYLPPGAPRTAELTPEFPRPELNKEQRRGYTKFFNFDLGSQELAKRRHRVSDGSFSVKQFVNLGNDDKKKISNQKISNLNQSDQKFSKFLVQSHAGMDNFEPATNSHMSTDLKPPGLREDIFNQTPKQVSANKANKQQFKILSFIDLKREQTDDSTQSVIGEVTASPRLDIHHPRETIYRGDINQEKIEVTNANPNVSERVVATPRIDMNLHQEAIDRSDNNEEEYEDFGPFTDIGNKVSAKLSIEYDSHPEAKLGELKFDLHPEEKLGENRN